MLNWIKKILNTNDLPSYIPGYDEYLKEIESQEEHDYYDEYRDEILMREELDKMERNIIDLSNTYMTFDEVMQLENYVWQGNLLIPEEKIGD